MSHHRWGACAAAAVWGALGLAVAIAPAAAQQAGSPVSFYAQTSVTMCIQAGGPIRELTPLVMGDCRGPAAAFVVDTREKKIRFHASPRFCIGFTNDGLAQVLQCDGTEQEYGYDRRTETIRFAPIPERLLIVWEYAVITALVRAFKSSAARTPTTRSIP